jgi:hypothetical protein
MTVETAMEPVTVTLVGLSITTPCERIFLGRAVYRGYSLQKIDLQDHLYYYDLSTSPKQYLKYSDTKWKRWFDNNVQYFNRLQRPQWHTIFDDAGLTLVNEDIACVDLHGLPIAEQYQNYDLETLCLSCATAPQT